MDPEGLLPLHEDDLSAQPEVEIPNNIGDDTNLEADGDMTKYTDKPELTAEEQRVLNNALLNASDATEIAELINRGADVNCRDNGGNTALMSAASSSTTETVALLLDKGADLNIATMGGWTALMSAAEYGPTETVALLLDRGADPNIATMGGWTALMSAAKYGPTETVALLLDRGADINARDYLGRTALMSATQKEHTSTVTLITEHQARLEELAKFLKSEYIDHTPNRYNKEEKDLFLKQCDSYNESNIKDALIIQGLSAIDVTTVYNHAKKEANDQKWNALLAGIDKERKAIHKGVEKPLLSHIAGENILHALPTDVLSIATQFLSEEDNKKARNDIRKATLRAPQTESPPPSTTAAVARAGGDIHDQAIQIGKGLTSTSELPPVDPKDHRKPSASHSPPPSPKKGPNR